ncbi:MAG TPA: quinoprotein dehydrogenase-associated putative ABC transporter substrate-binding protein [Gammaproteobacteria bacterium]|nr:quinoprotein dehydrogenase-associated putative ABC transporter substrate-binding protein [Gammaproteobacteria bacterium]
MSTLRAVALLAATCIATAQAGAQPGAQPASDTLKVCADPNNLPFSNRNEEGFENRLAVIWARELGLELEYTWFPQRRGFERNTLNAIDPVNGGYKCDVIVGVPDGYDLAMTTRPYYRSTYALVYLTDHGLNLGSGEELFALPAATRDRLRIGVFTPGPAADWLARHGMHRQMVPYSALEGDPNAYPGRVIDNELRAGELDAAILWGPIAGYFAARADTADVAIVPLRSEPGVRFDFSISAGVRFGDRELRARLESLMTRTADQTASLLAEYHVPLVNETATVDSNP